MIPRLDRATLLRQRWTYFDHHRKEILENVLDEITIRPLRVGALPRSAELDCAALTVSYLITLDVYAALDGWRTLDYGTVMLRLDEALWRPDPELWLGLELKRWRQEAASYPGPYFGIGDSLVRMTEVSLAAMAEWDGPVVSVCRGAAELALRRMAVAAEALRVVRKVGA